MSALCYTVMQNDEGGVVMFCPYCGAEAGDTNAFCTSCGQRLDVLRQTIEASQKMDAVDRCPDALGETRLIDAVGAKKPSVTGVVGTAPEPSGTQVAGAVPNPGATRVAGAAPDPGVTQVVGAVPGPGMTQVVGAVPASGETQVIGAKTPAPDKTMVFGAGAADEEYAALEAVLAKNRNVSYEQDFTGLEVLAGEQTGYIPSSIPSSIPPSIPSATGAMHAVDFGTPRSDFDAVAGENVVKSAPDAKQEKKKKRRKRIRRISLVILLLAIIAAVAGGLLWYSHEQDLKAKAHSMHTVPLTIVAEGYTEHDTGIPVMVEGTDLDGNHVSGMYYVYSGGGGIELLRGDYTFTFPASPIGAQGAMWGVETESIQVSIPDTIEADAAFEDAKNTPVVLTPIAPLDVTVDAINRSYEYAKYDPVFGSQAGAFRDAAIASHEEAILNAEAEAEAARIAEEEAAARAAEEEARAAASSDGYYLFSYAPTNTDTTQDAFGYWHIDTKKSKVIEVAESFDDLGGNTHEYVNSLVFRLPEDGVTYEASGGTAGVQPLSEEEGHSTFLNMLKLNSAQGLAIIVHVVDGEAVFVRFCS